MTKNIVMVEGLVYILHLCSDLKLYLLIDVRVQYILNVLFHEMRSDLYDDFVSIEEL